MARSDLLVSALPPTTFVLVNSMFGLTAGIVAALAAAVGTVVHRAMRRLALQPTIGGFVGVGISGFVAYQTGTATGYFLTDIWTGTICFCVLVVSILVRFPLVGVIWSVMNRAPMHWRRHRGARFAYDVATASAAVIAGARVVVQTWLYGEDLAGWMAAAKIAMGVPLSAVALGIAVWAVRRADRQLSTSAHSRDQRSSGSIAVLSEPPIGVSSYEPSEERASSPADSSSRSRS
ncbi:DUF3159 domain-containing protein [Pseudonocardia sp. TRM90224]|uniref:DUF3159 domain-containing protein n=1 Tax=Pseudonocardia sp. TRM90224 TaxID=2812678 RepID=UPI0027DF2BE6|nr:DUF3159 domain-containing protein [Pseudonocardia sp. TRM90224]